MTEHDLKCPKCGTKIEIDQEIIVQRVRGQIELELKKRLEANFEEKLKLEKEKFEQTIGETQAKELEAMKLELESKSKKIDDYREQELKLIKERNELEEAKKVIEITTQRRLTEEKKLLEEKLAKDFEEKKNFAEMELRKQLDDTKKALLEAQRKAAQGSMQTQGEVLELSLEENLKKKFPHDEIEPVGKGISGADIVQKVFAPNTELAGIIAWETKQTKAWTEEWVNKLKDDGHRVKANRLILVSNILPKEVEHFGQYKGIWVTDYASYLGLAAALRNNLISVYTVALAQENSQDKAQLLYKHLTGQAFANRVRTLAETFNEMKTNIEKEKRAFENIWASREKQIERLSSNTSQMFGEIQGIAGGTVSGIEILEEMAEEKLLDSEISSNKKKKSPSEGQANLF